MSLPESGQYVLEYTSTVHPHGIPQTCAIQWHDMAATKQLRRQNRYVITLHDLIRQPFNQLWAELLSELPQKAHWEESRSCVQLPSR